MFLPSKGYWKKTGWAYRHRGRANPIYDRMVHRAAAKIQGSFRRHIVKKKKTSQYRRNSYKTNRGRTQNTQTTSGKLNITKAHIPKATFKLLKKLTTVGIVENKVKVFKEARLTSCVGFTNNSNIGSMGFVVYNFSSGPINAADNLVATGIPAQSTINPPLPAPPTTIFSVKDLNIWDLNRDGMTGSTQSTAATLVGKSMFCKSLDFTVGIQIDPLLTTGAVDLATNPIGLYCVPWIFRVILVRQRPGSQTSGFSGNLPASFSERLILPYAGANYRVGFSHVSTESGETLPTPQDILYRKLNYQNYEVVRDFNLRLAPASILGNVSGSTTVGYKRLKFHLPINQELEYDMDVNTGEVTHPMNANMTYSLMIMSGVPAISHKILPEVVSQGVNATSAGHWSTTLEGRMTFTDS